MPLCDILKENAMTHNRFFISDTHFGHKGSLTWLEDDGSRVRPFWDEVDAMNETMVENWNSVVRPVDTIYHLGDVAMNRRYLAVCDRLNGKKRLIRGNHDIFKTKDYLKHFDEIYGVRVFTEKEVGFKVVFSHVPIHPESLSRWKANVHGHTHNSVMGDPRYINVCVEQTNYTPVSWDELVTQINKI